MLQYISIRNFVIIPSLQLEFPSGLSVFTGETGAGKSIIVDAIGLALGARVSSSVVGSYGDKAEISVMFDINRVDEGIAETVRGLLGPLDIALEGELIIRREIDAENRSKSFVNDRLVTLSFVKGFADLLVDIHGQNEHQKLLSPVNQLRALDQFGGVEDKAKEYRRRYQDWKRRAAELVETGERLKVLRERTDLLRHQVKEIDAAKLRSEDDALEQEFILVRNAQKVLTLCGEIQFALCGDGGILPKAQQVERQMRHLAELVGEPQPVDIGDIQRSVEELRDAVAAQEKRYAQFTTEYIDGLVDRVDLLKKLKRKYGATVADILAFREKAAAELASIETGEETLDALSRDVESLRVGMAALAAEMGAMRAKAAPAFETAMLKELRALGFDKAVFEVSVASAAAAPDAYGEHGLESVQFLVSANPGTEPGPLRTVVSGGELSRIMLALKTVLGKKERTPVMVFDEIDTGLGGPMGTVVGRKLRELCSAARPRNKQVFCVSHLPQLAVFADRHFHVSKRTRGGSTEVQVEPLPMDGRVQEIARMLSDGQITDTSVGHARKLIAEAMQQS